MRTWAGREIPWTDRATGLRSVSMGKVVSRLASAAELPLLLTVEEAAGVLRIGRTLAYSLARRYEESGGVTGLPVIRLGGCLRVPRWALLELACCGRVVTLSELVAGAAHLPSRLHDEPPVEPSGEHGPLLDVEQSASPKLKPRWPKRSASRVAPSGEVGQQLVLLPSE